MKRLLLVGRTAEPWCSDAWLAESFRLLDWQVTGFDARQQAATLGMDAMEERLLDQVRDHSVDLVLFTRGGLLTPTTVVQVGRYTHTHFRYIDAQPRTVLPVTRACHTVSVSDPEGAALLGGVCIPEGCFPAEHFPGTARPAWQGDVAMVGRAYANRLRIVTQMRRSGLTVNTYGDAQWVPPHHPGKLTGDNFRDMVATIPIHLAANLHNHIPGWTSNRLFLLLACGGFVLINFFPELEEWFELGCDLVWYHEEEEATEILPGYVSPPTSPRTDWSATRFHRSGSPHELDLLPLQPRLPNRRDMDGGEWGVQYSGIFFSVVPPAHGHFLAQSISFTGKTWLDCGASAPRQQHGCGRSSVALSGETGDRSALSNSDSIERRAHCIGRC